MSLEESWQMVEPSDTVCQSIAYCRWNHVVSGFCQRSTVSVVASLWGRDKYEWLCSTVFAQHTALPYG